MLRALMAFLSIGCVVIFVASTAVQAEELAVEDFDLNGPLGSQGSVIEKLGTNHFRMVLGHAPNHPEWCNKAQFRILRHARGNSLRLEVVFSGGPSMRLNEYFMSWSYDGANWHPIHWEDGTAKAATADTLQFPVFEQDTVWVGHQVPMSYEDSAQLVKEWSRDTNVSVTIVGKSLGGRNLYRVTITDPESQVPPGQRWVHYFANQHPGEHNSQWRMVAMVNWLLSDEGADFRRRSICHFVLMMSPDAPSKGWYRVNAEGVDMNRSYRAAGSSPKLQPHEAYLCQHDLEALMSSPTPVTSAWSMHTWGGVVEPILLPGPEMGTTLGPWTELRDAIAANDPQSLVKTLAVSKGKDASTLWDAGIHAQFGISAVLCEGAGIIDTKEQNLASGEALMEGIAQYYRGVKPLATGTGQ